MVYKVISEAASPMRAKDIHRACEEELGRPVAWSTVKTCLSDHSSGTRPRFERVGYGLYAPVVDDGVAATSCIEPAVDRERYADRKVREGIYP
jgi:hypothetical protein